MLLCGNPPLTTSKVSYPRNFLGHVPNVGYPDGSPKRVKPFRLIITAMQICRTGVQTSVSSYIETQLIDNHGTSCFTTPVVGIPTSPDNQPIFTFYISGNKKDTHPWRGWVYLMTTNIKLAIHSNFLVFDFKHVNVAIKPFFRWLESTS